MSQGTGTCNFAKLSIASAFALRYFVDTGELPCSPSKRRLPISGVFFFFFFLSLFKAQTKMKVDGDNFLNVQEVHIFKTET